ncbi:hypothetical protein EYC80_007167 [Monilinia laxa]|uniref:Uncharacterized protein n=1 Tax=Monilinia laxa TaxID=61186 RepID=A0A5N6K0E1_MONLA|nr:hypothetical protein EYC80_007167 [Monilinia laxa]
MHPQRTGFVQSKNSQEEARDENPLSPRDVANIDPAQDNPTASNRHAGSNPAHPPYWAPQPIHPPFVPDPDQQRHHTTSHPIPKRTHTKNHPKNRVNSSNSPIKPSGIKKSKRLSSDRATSRSLDLSASLDRFETSARNLTASMASVQAILADVSAEVVYEAVRFDGGRDAAVAGREDSVEDEGEDPSEPSSS